MKLYNYPGIQIAGDQDRSEAIRLDRLLEEIKPTGTDKDIKISLQVLDVRSAPKDDWYIPSEIIRAMIALNTQDDRYCLIAETEVRPKNIWEDLGEKSNSIYLLNEKGKKKIEIQKDSSVPFNVALEDFILKSGKGNLNEGLKRLGFYARKVCVISPDESIQQSFQEYFTNKNWCKFSEVGK